MDYTQLSRPLDISDVDFRVQSINKGGYATILAYKDARVDMNRLDEVLTPIGWQRDYKYIDGNLFCGVGIFDDDRDQWVWKWDVGTESMSDKEKGKASDSFKRACFNLGIGRELYSYPLITVKLNENEFTLDGGRAKQTFNLKIKEWTWYTEFSGKTITFIAAKDQNGVVRFKWGTLKEKKKVDDAKFEQASSTNAEATESVEDNGAVAIVAPKIEDMANPAGLSNKNPTIEDLPTLEVEQQKTVEEPEIVDTEKETLIAEYKMIFGKAPDKRFSVEKLKKDIDAETERILAEQLKEDEEVDATDAYAVVTDNDPVVEIPVEEDELDTILNMVPYIDTYSDANEFIKWAKQTVASYDGIDSPDVIESFKQKCNVHYSKITK